MTFNPMDFGARPEGCTCELIDDVRYSGGQPVEPAVWEQNPACPLHRSADEDCTCEMIRPAHPIHGPAEVEPDLRCPLHGCDYRRGVGSCVLVGPCGGSDGPACMENAKPDEWVGVEP